MLKKCVTNEVICSLEKIIIAFPNQAKAHGKEIESTLEQHLATSTAKELNVSMTKTLTCLSKLEGKNVHTGNTQQLLHKICSTSHFLLTEMTGGIEV
jgi:hypothetical protein